MKLAAYTKNNQCFLCPRHCIILEGKRGFCNTRKNINGKIYALNYGKPIGLGIDPIEKKPLFHFYPGEKILSFGTLGCNIDCKGCQNANISRGIPDENNDNLILPEEIIKIAKDKKIDMIAYTYTEPTIFFEYMIDVAVLAKKEGIKNVVVSNGYIEKEPLNQLLEVIDAFNIDLKFFDDKKYKDYSKAKLKPILDNIELINDSNSWLEITNLIIPNWSDDLSEIEDMCLWIKKTLSKEVPIHFSAFYPQHELMDVPKTNPKKLVKIKEIAKKYLDYVYLGNIGSEENTICPDCKRVLINRDWYNTKTYDFKGVCKCGKKIPGIWI